VSAEQVNLKEELRRTFLFESLTDEQLDWLVQHGTVESHDPGVNVYDEGAPAESFFVIGDGEIQLV
jgi:CRP-like cAMP-binding protein